MKRDSFPQALEELHAMPRSLQVGHFGAFPQATPLVTLGEAVSAANPTFSSKLLTFNFLTSRFLDLWLPELEATKNTVAHTLMC